MIIIKIFQGLGNQLFQYAFVRALSLRHHKTFKMDLSWYNEHSNHRPYALDKFNIAGEEATEKDIHDIKTCDGRNFIEYHFKRIRNKYSPYYKKNIISEKNSLYDENYLKINSNSFVCGYFSSELYFKDYASVIKNDLEFKDRPSPLNLNKIQKIQPQHAVCISIRRGDFVNNPVHDVCDLNYFYTSMEYMSEKINNPYFYIFSDDNDWVKNNFRSNYPHEFITNNYPDFIEDFRFMRNCRHHIIPNSTYSWWAAWLAEQPDSIIIAPQKWLNSGTIDYSNVVPERWAKIKNFD